MTQPRSSRRRYLKFVEDYRQRRLDAETEARSRKPGDDSAGDDRAPVARRREYMRDYLRWLWPHRYATAAVFGLALVSAGLEMIAPLFMRYIIDRVLLNTGLDTATRLTHLNIAGAVFVGVVIFENLVGAFKDYRQRLLNTRVILSLRRTLFRRFLHLPLPRLWDMKTGGILSRLTGDVETTTGLLQMAVVSPAISVLRLIIAVGVLLV